jgi:hypothetical protein
LDKVKLAAAKAILAGCGIGLTGIAMRMTGRVEPLDGLNYADNLTADIRGGTDKPAPRAARSSFGTFLTVDHQVPGSHLTC